MDQREIRLHSFTPSFSVYLLTSLKRSEVQLKVRKSKFPHLRVVHQQVALLSLPQEFSRPLALRESDQWWHLLLPAGHENSVYFSKKLTDKQFRAAAHALLKAQQFFQKHNLFTGQVRPQLIFALAGKFQLNWMLALTPEQTASRKYHLLNGLVAKAKQTLQDQPLARRLQILNQTIRRKGYTQALFQSAICQEPMREEAQTARGFGTITSRPVFIHKQRAPKSARLMLSLGVARLKRRLSKRQGREQDSGLRTIRTQLRSVQTGEREFTDIQDVHISIGQEEELKYCKQRIEDLETRFKSLRPKRSQLTFSYLESLQISPKAFPRETMPSLPAEQPRRLPSQKGPAKSPVRVQKQQRYKRKQTFQEDDSFEVVSIIQKKQVPNKQNNILLVEEDFSSSKGKTTLQSQTRKEDKKEAVAKEKKGRETVGRQTLGKQASKKQAVGRQGGGKPKKEESLPMSPARKDQAAHKDSLAPYRDYMNVLNIMGEATGLSYKFFSANGFKYFWQVAVFFIYKRFYLLRCEFEKKLHLRANYLRVAGFDQAAQSSAYEDWLRVLQTQNEQVRGALQKLLKKMTGLLPTQKTYTKEDIKEVSPLFNMREQDFSAELKLFGLQLLDYLEEVAEKQGLRNKLTVEYRVKVTDALLVGVRKSGLAVDLREHRAVLAEEQPLGAYLKGRLSQIQSS